MQIPVWKPEGARKALARAALAAACTIALVVVATFDEAQARKRHGHRHGGDREDTGRQYDFKSGAKLHQTPGHWERSRGGGLKWVGPGSPKGKSDPGVRNHGAKVRDHLRGRDYGGSAGGVTVKDSVTGKRGFCKSPWWQLRC